MSRTWTIGMVSYNSAVYIKWQLKILFEFNEPEQFQVIIVDNSNPHQINELEECISPYRKYNNVKIIYHKPIEKTASGQHGEGLDIIKEQVDTKYLLVQDPDFFWVINNHLEFLKKYIDAGNLAIGAPYQLKIGIGDPLYPAA